MIRVYWASKISKVKKQHKPIRSKANKFLLHLYCWDLLEKLDDLLFICSLLITKLVIYIINCKFIVNISQLDDVDKLANLLNFGQKGFQIFRIVTRGSWINGVVGEWILLHTFICTYIKGKEESWSRNLTWEVSLRL